MSLKNKAGTTVQLKKKKKSSKGFNHLDGFVVWCGGFVKHSTFEGAQNLVSMVFNERHI